MSCTCANTVLKLNLVSSFSPGIKQKCTVGRDFYCDLEKKTCVDLSKTCDGMNNCPNATDEGPACKFSSCKFDNGGCTQVCYTTPAGKFCTLVIVNIDKQRRIKRYGWFFCF